MAVVTIDDTTVTGSGTAPDAPTGLTTEKEWDAVRLHWTNPTQRDVDYIQIWRHTANDRTGATMVAQVKANDYTDHSLETGTRYYWIRAISTTGLTSAYHPTSATGGVSGLPEQVAVTSAVDKDILQYDSASSSWVNTAVRDGTRINGALLASTNASYSVPPLSLNTITNNNGMDASSSFSTALGNGASGQFVHYYGDTLASSFTAPVFSFKTANGTSANSGTVAFTGNTASGPSAVVNNNVMGGINFNGYASTGFSDYIISQYQGGGVQASHALQLQGYATETFAEGTTSITPTSVTRINVTQTVTNIAGSRGQLTIPATVVGVGTAVIVSGTNSGTGVITNGTYYVVAINVPAGSSATLLTLSATPGGAPISTTAGTVIGLTFTRQAITIGYTSPGYIPFGAGAKVAISGINNVTDGTYMTLVATTTSATIGATSSGATTLGATPLATVTSVTACGSAYRVRGFPAGTVANTGNRVTFIDHSAASATYRADTFNIAGGAYGNTSTTRLQVDSSKITASLPVVFPNYTVAALTLATRTLVGAVGWQVAVSDSPTYAGRMAYWSTTATAGWYYIDDNTAV